MATAKRGPSAPVSTGTEWRRLDPLNRFLVLLNHFGSADALSAASGIPAKTIRATFTRAVLQHKNAPILEREDWILGFRRARHRMTDQVRRVVERAKKGGFEAPIIRTKTGVLQPQRRIGSSLLRDYHGRVREVPFKSKWYSYNVEFLTEAEIRGAVEQLFDIFMATGQFNAMRYEYITHADTYSEGEFRDRELHLASEEMEYIKLSTGQFPFSEYVTPAEFGRAVMGTDPLYGWRYLKAKGAVRMTELFFAKFDDIERGEPMQLARAEYERRKRGKRGKRKDGRGV